MKCFKQITMMCLTVMALMTTTSCSSKIGDKYRAHFANETAIDLSDLLKIYHESEKADKEHSDYDLTAKLLGKNYDATERILIIDDNSFAIKLPQYAGSKQPFLANAEVFYNACLLGFNVWSNHELWLRGCDGFELASTDDVVEGINAINENCINDETIREAAKEYKTQILEMMKRHTDEWDEDESSMSLLVDYGEKIEEKAYMYYTDEELFVDSLDDMTKELVDAMKPTFEQYLQCDSANRIEFMLNSLNCCRTFDEQCSLFLNWADSKEAEVEDEWVIAVAERLMKSGRYNPCLNNIWMMWRCLFQDLYCGISRNSCIPNDLYNDMRRHCYLTCLTWLESHPNDVFAMNCATAIGGRINLNRFGQYMFGNDAPTEKRTYLSGRYEKED